MDATNIPLVGEPLALDFVNTRFQPPGQPEVDLLATPERFHAWQEAQAGRLTPLEGRIDLAPLRALRDHISRAVEHARQGSAPPARSLRALTNAQRSAPAYSELVWDGRVKVTSRRNGDPAQRLLAELAAAAANLLEDAAIRTVRQCEGPGCRLLFLPAHRRRRWCSPALCGNRVRVARYYQRHKT